MGEKSAEKVGEEECLTDFNFYLKFAKPLVLNLKNPSDRVLAAAWIKKLRDESVADEDVRKNYLKLLLFVLHRRRLIGPFAQNPATFNQLDRFPPDLQILDIARDLIIKDAEEQRDKAQKGIGDPSGAGDYPPYHVEVSADLLEYAAAQDIPKFGVQAYYALSSEPVTSWDNAECGVFPKGITDAVQKPTASMSEPVVTDKEKEKAPRRLGDLIKKKEGKSPEKEKPGSPAKPGSPKAGTSAKTPTKTRSEPSTPGAEAAEGAAAAAKAKSPSPFGSPPPVDERTPVTWGSNLLEVSESPLRGLLQGNIDDFLLDEQAPDLMQTPDAGDQLEAGFSPDRTPPRPDYMDMSLPYQTPKPMYGDMSLPYQTPEPKYGDMSLPYQTPPARAQDYMDISLPYQTPQPKYGDMSLPYQTPEPKYGDMSLPYQTPPRRPDDYLDMSLPYKTPPYDPQAIARQQERSLMSSLGRPTNVEAMLDAPPPPIEHGTPSAQEIIEEVAESLTEAKSGESMVHKTPSSRASIPGTSRLPGPGTSRLPGPGTSRLPGPGTSRLPGPGTSRLPGPGTSRLPGPGMGAPRPSGLRAPGASRLPAPGTVGLPTPPPRVGGTPPRQPAYPHRRPDVVTPPMFSRYGGADEGAAAYSPSYFGLPDEEAFAQAGDIDFQNVPFGSPSKPSRGYMTRAPTGLDELFPNLQAERRHQDFFQSEEMDLVSGFDSEEERLTEAPKEDLEAELRNLVREMREMKENSPAAAGVALTTPRSSPSPMRLHGYGEHSPLHFQSPPEFFKSPPTSPGTRIAEQMARLYTPEELGKKCMAKKKTPTPPRDPNIDEFDLPVLQDAFQPLPEQEERPALVCERKSPQAEEAETRRREREAEKTPEIPPETEIIPPPSEAAEEVNVVVEENYAYIYNTLITDTPVEPRTPPKIEPPPRTKTPSPVASTSTAPSPRPSTSRTPSPKASTSKTPSPRTPPRQIRYASPPAAPLPFPQDYQQQDDEGMLACELVPEEFFAPGKSPPPPGDLQLYSIAEAYSPLNVDDEEDEIDMEIAGHDMVPYLERPLHATLQTGRRRMRLSRHSLPPAFGTVPEHVIAEEAFREREELRRHSPYQAQPWRTPSPVCERNRTPSPSPTHPPTPEIALALTPPPQPHSPPRPQTILEEAQAYFTRQFEGSPEAERLANRVMALVEDVEGPTATVADYDAMIESYGHDVEAIEARGWPTLDEPTDELEELYKFEETIEDEEDEPIAEPPQEAAQFFDFQGPRSSFMPVSPITARYEEMEGAVGGGTLEMSPPRDLFSPQGVSPQSKLDARRSQVDAQYAALFTGTTPPRRQQIAEWPSGIPAPGTSGIPAPGTSRLPGPPRTSGLPRPGTSRLPGPPGSGIPGPGKGICKLPGPRASGIPAPGTSRAAAPALSPQSQYNALMSTINQQQQMVMDAANAPRPPSPARGPPAQSQLPQPGTSRLPAPPGSRLPAPGGRSRLPAPGTSGLPAPGTSRLPAPGASKLPGPGLVAPRASGLRAPGASGLRAPGASGLRAPGASGLRAPGASGLRAPGTSGLPMPGTSGPPRPPSPVRVATPPRLPTPESREAQRRRQLCERHGVTERDSPDAQPGDMMGVAYDAPYYEAPAQLMDEPISPDALRSPLRPRFDVAGWQTPPHLALQQPQYEPQMVPSQASLGSARTKTVQHSEYSKSPTSQKTSKSTSRERFEERSPTGLGTEQMQLFDEAVGGLDIEGMPELPQDEYASPVFAAPDIFDLPLEGAGLEAEFIPEAGGYISPEALSPQGPGIDMPTSPISPCALREPISSPGSRAGPRRGRIPRDRMQPRRLDFGNVSQTDEFGLPQLPPPAPASPPSPFRRLQHTPGSPSRTPPGPPPQMAMPSPRQESSSALCNRLEAQYDLPEAAFSPPPRPTSPGRSPLIFASPERSPTGMGLEAQALDYLATPPTPPSPIYYSPPSGRLSARTPPLRPEHYTPPSGRLSPRTPPGFPRGYQPEPIWDEGFPEALSPVSPQRLPSPGSPQQRSPARMPSPARSPIAGPSTSPAGVCAVTGRDIGMDEFLRGVEGHTQVAQAPPRMVRSGKKLVPIGKGLRRPSLARVHDLPEPGASPPTFREWPSMPVAVTEGELVPLSPPRDEEVAMEQHRRNLATAEAQYASLFEPDVPPPAPSTSYTRHEFTEEIEERAADTIMDAPVMQAELRRLPTPAIDTRDLEWQSPPRLVVDPNVPTYDPAMLPMQGPTRTWQGQNLETMSPPLMESPKSPRTPPRVPTVFDRPGQVLGEVTPPLYESPPGARYARTSPTSPTYASPVAGAYASPVAGPSRSPRSASPSHYHKTSKVETVESTGSVAPSPTMPTTPPPGAYYPETRPSPYRTSPMSYSPQSTPPPLPFSPPPPITLDMSPVQPQMATMLAVTPPPGTSPEGAYGPAPAQTYTSVVEEEEVIDLFDIGPAFGGEMEPGILDTSDIPEEDLGDADFCWMDRR